MQAWGLRAIVAWLVATVAVFGVFRYGLALPEECGNATVPEIDTAIANNLSWLATNQQPDGTWTYRYRPSTDQDLGGYNWVRHAGTMLSLYQAANADWPGALETGDRGREVVLAERLVHGTENGQTWTALDDGVLSTGGTALLTVALAERRDATGSTEDDELLRSLGRYLARTVEPSGAVLDYGSPDGTLVPGSHSPFTTGEAFFALAKLHQVFPGEGWDEPAMRIGNYVVHDRADAEGYVPDASDHWASYAFAVLHQWPERATSGLTADELGFARRQLGLMSIQTRYETGRTNKGIALLRGRAASGAGIGTIGEAMGQWWTVVVDEPALDGSRGHLRDRIECMAGTTIDRQIDATDAANYPNPERALGAFTQFGVTQVDDQQHTMSALLAARHVLAGVSPIPPRDPLPTNVWVAALAAIAALNPVRLAAGAAGARRTRMSSVGIAGVVVTCVVGLLAAVGGPLLRALEISVPNGLVAAAFVLIGGAIYCLATPDEAQPADAPSRGLLVPLVIPLALRPDLLLFALVAGAGGRGWTVFVAVAVAAVGAIAMAAAPTPQPVVHRWLMRVVGTVALATAIALAVDGIYAI